MGEHDLESEIDCENGNCADPLQVIEIKNIIVPQEYDEAALKHDIAIAELSHEANITNFVNSVP